MGADDDRNWVGVVFERTKRIMEDVCECYWLNLGISCRIWDLLIRSEQVQFKRRRWGEGRYLASVFAESTSSRSVSRVFFKPFTIDEYE